MTLDSHIVENPEPRAWDEFARRHHGHLLQSSGWANLKAQFGWNPLRIALEDRDNLLAGAQVLLRRMPLGTTLAYVPRGPIWDTADPDRFATLLHAVRTAVQRRGAFALKIEPDWEKGETEEAQAADALARAGFSPTLGVQPRATIHLDLTPALDQILAQMKPKWRYNIRLAGRKGVTVRRGTGADLPLFFQMLQVTGVRDRFAIHSLEYYRTAFAELSAAAGAALLIAEHDGQVLAAIIVTAFANQAIYLYGASGNAHRELMPNHALHWAAIQWAKERGCTCYDLWGIGTGQHGGDGSPASLGESQDGSTLPDGLYQFKQGFGGRVIKYVGAYDAVFSRTRYALYNRLLALRRASAA